MFLKDIIIVVFPPAPGPSQVKTSVSRPVQVLPSGRCKGPAAADVLREQVAAFPGEPDLTEQTRRLRGMDRDVCTYVDEDEGRWVGGDQSGWALFLDGLPYLSQLKLLL